MKWRVPGALLFILLLAFNAVCWAAAPLPAHSPASPQPAAASAGRTPATPSPATTRLPVTPKSQQHHHRKLWIWISVAATAGVVLLVVLSHRQSGCQNCICNTDPAIPCP